MLVNWVHSPNAQSKILVTVAGSWIDLRVHFLIAPLLIIVIPSGST